MPGRESAGALDSAALAGLGRLPERGFAHGALVALLLALYLVLLHTSLRTTSITTDELGHLPLAYGYLSSGDSRWLLMNPPSQRLVAALPLLLEPGISLEVPRPRTDLDFWRVGRAFLEQNRDAYVALYARARSAVSLLACVAGLLLYGLARSLAGPRAGLLALALFALSPDFLAHGGLVTTDLSAALAGAAAALSALAYARHRSVPRLALVTVSTALLALSKFTALWFLPLVSLLLIHGHRTATAAGEPRGGAATPSALVREHVLIGAGAWLILCAAYGFQGLLLPLRDLELVSRPATAVQSALPWLPLPIPAAYLHAFDLQAFDATRPWRSYLLGEAGPETSLGYYPIAALFKLPLPLLLAIPLCALVARREALWVALAPALAYFALLALVPGKQTGFRFALPAVAFLLVFVAATLARPAARGTSLRRALRPVALALLGWYALGTLRAHPHYIAYFNELAGGTALPHRGHEVLADSNLDWGQDWIRLAEWQRETHSDDLSLAYFGLVDPSVHGVRYRPADCEVASRVLAVSVNLVLGIDPFARRLCFASLRQRPPDARVGAAVWVYRFSDPERLEPPGGALGEAGQTPAPRELAHARPGGDRLGLPAPR